MAVVLVGARSLSRAPAPGLQASPDAAQLKVRVGDRLPFVVAAEGALQVAWSVGDGEASRDAAWWYTPGSADIGKQTVRVAVTGEDGVPHTRSWEVVVTPLAAPELLELSPPPGAVALSANDPATFRCHARLSMARPSERLRFEWLVNDRLAFSDEQPATGGVSEFPLATAEPGTQRVAVRVAESTSVTSAVEWVVEIAPPAGAPLVAIAETKAANSPMPRALAATPSVAAAPPAPASPSEPHLPASGTTLERIDVQTNPGPVVLVHLSGPTSPRASILPGHDGGPYRVYIDLPGARLAPTTAAAIDGTGPLLRVRSGQFDPNTARVVLDLASAMPFVMHRSGQTLTVELGPHAEIAGAPVPEIARAPVPETARAPVPVEHRPQRALPEPSLPVVVLDAGHGGRDPGAAGIGGVREKDVVLEITRRLADVLSARLHVTVVMTRTDDSFVPIDARLAMTREDAALFLSLHANACADPSPRGFEVFYGGGRLRTASTQGGDPRAALLGRCLHRALRGLGVLRHEAQPAGYGVLARNHVPSALVEIGYLTHPQDAALAQDPHYQDLLAEALADGVESFLRASAPRL